METLSVLCVALNIIEVTTEAQLNFLLWGGRDFIFKL